MSQNRPIDLEPKVTPNSRTVLEKRYLVRDAQGRVHETPAELFWRVAYHIAEGDRPYTTGHEVDALARRFYGMLARLEFMPNSPTLMNAGRPLGQLSACFVLPINDSMESIFETLKHAAIIHQSGGGTGFSFSNLRPKGDVVRSTMGVSSGPVSFMEVYNAATEAIKQGGTRRGANMGILRIDHPDTEEFIACKNDLTRITNFNISVAVTDAFMDAVEQDAEFALLHPGTAKVVKTMRARKLFDQIVDHAWRTGEPGLIFIDRINRDNPTPAVGEIEATNPCGEVPLLPYEACNLGSINLARMLSGANQLDWDKLAETVRWATRFLDNVITQNRYPLTEIKRQVEGNRKIGLGVMGWADLLLALKIPYDSEEAVQLAEDVASWVDYHSKQESVTLAKARGAFPNFSESRFNTGNWLSEKHAEHATRKISLTDWKKLDRLIHEHGLRNATTTCVAPTGTISMIAGCSGGIEPLFSVVFKRNVLDGTEMTEIHPLFEATIRDRGFYSQALMDTIAVRGSVQELDEASGNGAVPEDIQRLYVTSHDISPDWHVRMQSAFQKFTDNAVSKTINFPRSAPREAIAQAYWQAYRSGVIKGITVYRDHSRQDQPMLLEGHPEVFGTPSCLECD